MPVVRISDKAHEIAVIEAGERSVEEKRMVPVSELVSELIVKSWSKEEDERPKDLNGAGTRGNS